MTKTNDEHGPIWIVNAPTADYPDERFDGVTPPLDPQQEPLYVCYVCGAPTDGPHTNHEGEDVCSACCDVCRDEQIAAAARRAVDDMQLVLRIWPYGPLSPLTWMKALVALLTPPAPKWTATEEPE